MSRIKHLGMMMFAATSLLSACGPGSDPTRPPASSSGQGGSSSSSGSTSSSSGGQCTGAVCAMYCEFGNVLDANGCPICACNPGPAECAAIQDINTCRNTAGCVAVQIGDAQGEAPSNGDRAAVAPPSDPFQCCTVGANGEVDCGTPPPAGCTTDADCASGTACVVTNCGCGGSTEPAMDPPEGGGAAPRQCDMQCQGQCMPVERTCFDDSACGQGEFCDVPSDCSTSTEPVVGCGGGDGAPVPPQCQGVCHVREVPQGCMSDDQCSAGQVCNTTDYCDSACGSDPSNTEPSGCIAVCVGRCEVPTVPSACAAVLCAENTTCEACGPNEDCVVKCVAIPQDPCASLSETECSTDADLCEPQYTTACEDNGFAPCQRAYVGCVSLQG